ncbi:hypothetical protein SEA_GETALONG_94 [Gordonia phage Getalong]|uniref:Uncharacterized protein n=4 Tax=Getalongvirus TaxID=2733156 RepID=A0A3S9UQ10_9CAUD|nr:hypothetical protein HOS44_gp091 [Gordonia phage BENtherdunthat]YP_009814207.1 hypothetical protein HOU38_gp094 [Gordonia phage Getalong]YP_009818702.1 hypothetical protein HOU97_gp86 [Gordonia phage Kenna]QCG77249.1 hypothetical protein SEA_LUTUM_92 [Gordonia phage Lutum]USH45593.1 hypothetical protein SEA_PHABULOSO_98 [Gordonia phage Phabuloso]ATW60861.1 hypothetical protein SEA_BENTHERDUNTHAT_91 [Gordonia phage BENtherdunthat]AYD83954.1 hypothetical protein SEA_GETALONG_94 [Gordonia pha
MSDYLRRLHPDNAVSRIHRWETTRWDIYLQVNTGPPTWWLPQGVCRTPAEVPRRGRGLEVMVGWLRACVAVTFVERRCHCGALSEISGMCAPCKFAVHEACFCSVGDAA